jgi:hypothetical protein
MDHASKLPQSPADVHDIYQVQVVPEELLEDRPPVTYTVTHSWRGKLVCPFPCCEAILNDGWNLHHHFRYVHPQDLAKRKYQQCRRCGMQVSPFYPQHYALRECQIRVERKQQREAAVQSALALRQEFLIHGDVLERVEVLKYLGRLLAQDDNDIQAVRAQIGKARATWSRVCQVLWSEHTPPQVTAKFYTAVVQAMLLYGSKTWVLSPMALACLEGFHIRAAY